ncbi:YceI family protein [Oceanibaculum pacificum]|uniref:Lipid/polyisoprenoid-binding YceI-like domain-containing protein n=1 Tax=Oceanibaculum pacificum TaxID=580166 RepID=A0A154WG64_9PROT|nr:YceI family protein [Oceanibaculum pacificum]KZD12520.1 hypothetical protein AUP43_16125 [Oceanibaculum pacificum]
MTRFSRSLLALAVAVPLAFASQAEAAPERYRIDSEHMAIGFLVQHIGYASTLGQFREAEGGFTFDEQARTLTDLKVSIKTASVYTAHEKRDEHLRKADFLNVAKYPEMTFVMTRAEPTGARTGKVTGDLTLLGVTKPVTLDVTWNKSGEYPFGGGVLGKPNYVTGISARGSFKRSDFGMDYGVADGLVGDDIQLIIELEAIRQ